VCVADRRSGKPDHAPDRRRGGVRCHPEHKLTKKLLTVLKLVVRLEPIILFEQVIDKIGCFQQMLSGAVRQDHVLDAQFDKLVIVPERLAVDVSPVPQLTQVCRRYIELGRPDSGHRQVGHVVSHGAVFERRDAVFGPQNTFF
jgi:hypothetical protein